jgi:hypothetical protein
MHRSYEGISLRNWLLSFFLVDLLQTQELNSGNQTSRSRRSYTGLKLGFSARGFERVDSACAHVSILVLKELPANASLTILENGPNLGRTDFPVPTIQGSRSRSSASLSTAGRRSSTRGNLNSLLNLKQAQSCVFKPPSLQRTPWRLNFPLESTSSFRYQRSNSSLRSSNR